MRKHAAGTGGGPRTHHMLTELEERLLALMGEVAVVGLPGVGERGLAGPSRPVAPSTPYHLSPPFFGSPLFPCDALRNEISPILPTRSTARRTHHQPIISAPYHLNAENLIPPPQPSPLSLAPSPSRPDGRVRRRRSQTPFERVTAEFVKAEERRLRVEEMRARNEARYVDIMQTMVGSMSRMEQLMQAWFDDYVARDVTVRLDTD